MLATEADNLILSLDSVSEGDIIDLSESDPPAIVDSDDYEEEVDPGDNRIDDDIRNNVSQTAVEGITKGATISAQDGLADVDSKQVDRLPESTSGATFSASSRPTRTEDDDVASKAAVALAAVAAAATANNKSPAEAGREARDLAQSFIRTAVTVDTSNGAREFINVSLNAVKAQLLQRALANGSNLADRLCQSDNDAFLQHLLLLEYVRCIDETAEHEEAQDQGKTNDIHSDIVTVACDKLETVLKRIEAAYECLVGMLPPVPAHRHTRAKRSSGLGGNTELASFHDTDVGKDLEQASTIPDLLPPCTSAQGDATVAFFRACLGESNEAINPKHNRFFVERTLSNSSMNSNITSITKQSEESKESSSIKDSESTIKPPDMVQPTSPGRQSVSVFSSMFKRSTTKPTKQQDATNSGGIVPSLGSSSITGVFRKKRSLRTTESDDGGNSTFTKENDCTNGGDDVSNLGLRPGEYVVRIEREMLGLTVENVLERTVVRTVVAGGPAKKAGAKVGSLIVKVGNVETKNLTHFETIDELRQSNRPLQLIMREISEDALRSAREEMGRLIRGSGFGTILDSYSLQNRGVPGGDGSTTLDGDGIGGDNEHANDHQKAVRPLIGADLRLDAYTTLLRRRFAETAPQPRNKKEEAVARVGEKLVWILTLFVIGLERESTILRRQCTANSSFEQHSLKDYLDAARSVSKVLNDYTRKTIDPRSTMNNKARSAGTQQQLANKGLSQPPPPPPPRVGRGGKRQPCVPGINTNDDSSVVHEKPLLQIGDVLQRTRTFLADTSSPPAALLRGEVISFLCDVLDIDTEMELSEEEATSATAGSSAGAINDLGSAGSLLKLIILNCNHIRSPNCEEEYFRKDTIDVDIEDELKRRFGPKNADAPIDVHKLHAGNRFLAVVHRLAASRSTSARVTACSLGPVLWGYLDFPHLLQLRGVITRALHDVEVIVRKSTATVLHEIAELVFDQRSVPWLVLMCERAMTDPEPQLRSAAMTLTWHLGEHLPNAFLGDASQGSRYLRRLPSRDDPFFADVYLLQCKLLPVATRLAEDRSPSVRLAVAAQCDRLCDALGDHWSSVIIDVLHGLLTDSDERVRCEAVTCVPRISEIVLLSASPGETAVSEISILESLIPASIKLQKDQSISVRVALAAAAGELLTLLVALQRRLTDWSPLLSHDLLNNLQGGSDRRLEYDSGKRYKSQVDDRLIPLVQILLNDTDPEVTSAALRAVTNATRSSQHSRIRRMSVASEDDSSMSSYHSHTSNREKPVFLPVLSENQVLRLLPTLAELAESRQWRVRQSAVEIVPALLGCTQQLETRSEISKLCVRLMGDKVDAVRKTAAECLCMGGSSLGSHGEDASGQWISSIVIPNIRRCAFDPQSKQRLLSLKMIEVILLNGVCPTKWYSTKDNLTDSPMRDLVAIALSLTNDRIANVRLNVGRVLGSVLHAFDEQEIMFIKEVMSKQIATEQEREGGGDSDVKFFANLCMTRAILCLNDKVTHDNLSEL